MVALNDLFDIIRKERSFLENPRKDPKARMRDLIESEKMRGRYLGACLDSCRWGGETVVMWDTNVAGLMELIQRWRDENGDDKGLYYPAIIDQRYKKLELPHITHKSCPRREEHSGTFVDGGGRVRCAHREIKMMRPNFIVEYAAGFDEASQMQANVIYEKRLIDPTSWDENGNDLTDLRAYERYSMELERFKSERPTERVVDVCYAILNDHDVVLPFETVLRRLNLAPETITHYCPGTSCITSNQLANLRDGYEPLCGGHKKPNLETVFPFDGWTLARYLQSWKEQSSSPSWFAQREEHLTSNLHRGNRTVVNLKD